jgi:hypothetical protein
MRGILTVAMMGALCAATHAEIDTYLDCYYQPSLTPGSDPAVPDFNDGTYFTVDLCVGLTDGDDWTVTEASATIDNAEFFDHPFNDETPPWFMVVPHYPALEFDSFYCSTGADSYNIPPYEDPVIAAEHHEAQYRYAVWCGVPPNGGEGAFLIARYTIKALPEDLAVTFHVQGYSMTVEGEETPYPFELTCVIPEPASLLLLGLLLIRHR